MMDRERLITEIHEALGGDGWGYSDYGHEELRTRREELEQVADLLTAIACARAKSSKAAAWSWADDAIRHAALAGIADPKSLVQEGRYPGLDRLEAALNALSTEKPERAETCVFCNSPKLHLITIPWEGGSFQVECRNCWSRGPAFAEEQMALENYRVGESAKP